MRPTWPTTRAPVRPASSPTRGNWSISSTGRPSPMEKCAGWKRRPRTSAPSTSCSSLSRRENHHHHPRRARRGLFDPGPHRQSRARDEALDRRQPAGRNILASSPGLPGPVRGADRGVRKDHDRRARVPRRKVRGAPVRLQQDAQALFTPGKSSGRPMPSARIKHLPQLADQPAALRRPG